MSAAAMGGDSGVCWQLVVCLGAATFSGANYLTRWLVPGGPPLDCTVQ
jgi:hypothetical protein